jgi:hypothetical protein
VSTDPPPLEKTMGLQRIDALLGTGELRTLAAGARRIRVLDRAYRVAAPAELAAGSHVKTCKAGALVVVADNAAVAAKLRQMTGRLLAAIRQSAPEVEAIRIEVDVGGAGHEDRPAPAKAALGQEAVRNFAELAQRVPEGGLKNALADLVKHHSPRK